MSTSSENMHAKREKIISELLKGQEMAKKLQKLLREPVQDHGPVSVDSLALEILRSFTEPLSKLSSCAASTGSADSAQIAAVDGGASACSGEGKKKKPEVKDRRGCYKRRRTCDSMVTVSSVVEDGYAWRKYGQKPILNSEYPRCYFRCTHKYQGCKAIKQVQRIKGDTILYQITYFNHHTCTTNDHHHTRPLILDSDPVEPNLLSFQTNIQSNQDHHGDDRVVMIKKEEYYYSKEDTLSTDQDVLSDAKSSVDRWEDIIGSGSFGYRPIWVEGGSSASTSLHDLDLEVNQLGDIDNFPFDDMY